MQKLLTKFKADQTEANWTKLYRYMQKHPMAVCMLSTSDVAFLYQSKIKFGG